jgi:hypothetical protein
MNANYVKLNLFSTANWQDEDIESLILLLDSQSSFRPEKWGFYEPLKSVFSRDVISDAQVRWKSKRGASLLFGINKYDVSMMMVQDLAFKKPNWISVTLKDEFFTDEQQTEAFLDFAKQLFSWGRMIYGYASHRLAFERKNKLSVPTRIEGKLISIGGSDIRRCLPGIYWANFFGDQYVKWFGESKFQNLPSYTQQELPEGGRLILSSSSPLDYEQNTVVERELFMRKKLGVSAFFDIQNPTRLTDSPFKDGFLQIE